MAALKTALFHTIFPTFFSPALLQPCTFWSNFFNFRDECNNKGFDHETQKKVGEEESEPQLRLPKVTEKMGRELIPGYRLLTSTALQEPQDTAIGNADQSIKYALSLLHYLLTFRFLCPLTKH
jgi:hypothetical protein